MSIAGDLSALLGAGLVSDGESVLDQHAADLTYHPPHRPDAVVFPESTDDVARVLAWADAAAVPVVPYGAATSLEGHVIPVARRRQPRYGRMNRSSP